jgi:hypothetical protein
MDQAQLGAYSTRHQHACCNCHSDGYQSAAAGCRCVLSLGAPAARVALPCLLTRSQPKLS